MFFAGVNADFMEGFAQVTAPLRRLIKEGVKFQWTPEFQKAFDQVKAILTGDTGMAYFDPQRQTKLKTDARPRGIEIRPTSKTMETSTYTAQVLSLTLRRDLYSLRKKRRQ